MIHRIQDVSKLLLVLLVGASITIAAIVTLKANKDDIQRVPAARYQTEELQS